MLSIQDDYLPTHEFLPLQKWFLAECTWTYVPYVLNREEDDFQFVHMFWYPTKGITSQNISILNPLLDKINPNILVRIKANLNIRTDEMKLREYHVDIGPYNHTTSIYYLNTNNGSTYFEDGTEVESVANRLLTFNSSMKHAGSTCTDEKIRVVLNLNYF
tara:strand:- start:105 stop:584 length:480 start_codon:yes stop_codon:yes gene_type:complete